MDRTKTAVLSHHLREHAVHYFPEFQGRNAHVRVVWRQVRIESTVYLFEIIAEATRKSVLVKAPGPSARTRKKSGNADQPLERRPRLIPPSTPGKKEWLEYSGLSAIHDYFEGVDDARFGAIRVLDFLPEERAIVVEASQDPSLDKLLLKESRPLSLISDVDLEMPFRNSGAWLRAYHAFNKFEDVRSRHSERIHFIEAVNQLAEYLAARSRERKYFERVASLVENRASDILPISLPLGLLHGDYAPRNILVGANNRVSVFDTRAIWRFPIYKDIGNFLMSLETNRLQVYTQGLAFSRQKLDGYRHAFLAGYYGQDPIPYEVIRLYELKALLDKWTSLTESALRGFLGQTRLGLTNRWFRKQAESLLKWD